MPISDTTQALKPTHGTPHDAESIDGCEGIGWDLSWGFRLNVGHDDAEDPTSPLTIGANFSDADQARGIVVRETTPQQLEEFARLLLNLAAKHRQRMAARPTIPATPLVLERVRTDDGAYRIFEPNGVGTGSVTYDPLNGEHGYFEVSGSLSQDFSDDAEERLLHDVLELRGDEGVFERLEYLYQRQAERASRPNPGCTCAPDVNDGDPGTWCTTCRQGPRAAGSQPSGSAS